jgi:hypothetical protein
VKALRQMGGNVNRRLARESAKAGSGRERLRGGVAKIGSSHARRTFVEARWPS